MYVDMEKVGFRIVAIASGFLKKTCIHKPTLAPVKLIEKAFSMMQNADLEMAETELRREALKKVWSVSCDTHNERGNC